MPEYLSPGVYVQEVDSGPRPIEGVGTATAAFVGFAPAGPANKPVLVTNWSQYVETFGRLEEGGRRNPHMSGAYLSHAVYGYFLNGGGRAYVTRVAPTKDDGKAATVQLPSRASKATPALAISAKGAPGEDIQVEVAPATGDGASDDTFTLKVKMGGVTESYDNITFAKKGKSPVETINQASQLIVVAEQQASGAVAERTPETGTYVLKAAAPSVLPQVQAPQIMGDVAERTGLEGLEVAEDVTMVACPDVMAAYEAKLLDRDGVKMVQLAMIAHCERMGNRFAIIDPLPDLAPQDVKQWREVETNFDSKYAALYYPWVKVSGPDGKPLAVPPSGHVAGIYARSDNEQIGRASCRDRV